MGEPMAVRVEIWPLAADENGIWLLSGGNAWRTGPIPADSEPLFEVKLLVSDHNPRMKLDVIHSTFWRVDGPEVILTWVGSARAMSFGLAGLLLAGFVVQLVRRRS